MLPNRAAVFGDHCGGFGSQQPEMHAQGNALADQQLLQAPVMLVPEGSHAEDQGDKAQQLDKIGIGGKITQENRLALAHTDPDTLHTGKLRGETARDARLPLALAFSLCRLISLIHTVQPS